MSFVKNAVNALFSTAGNYLPGTLGQRLKDYADNTDAAKGAALVGVSVRGMNPATNAKAVIEDIYTGATEAHFIAMNKVACWGDSLTAGSGGVPYTTPLAELTAYTVYNGGVGGETSTQIKTRMIADAARRSSLVIIWAGRNNYADAVTVKADIAEMVASLGHDGYLILGVINGNYGGYERVGGAGYAQITTLNADLATIYGTKFINIRLALVQAYNAGITQDVLDFADGIVPTSLRSDAIHLNTAGYNYVANVINTLSNLQALRGTRAKVITSDKVISLFGSPPAIGFKAASGGKFTSLLSDFFQLGGKNISKSGDGTTIQMGAKFAPDVDNTYDLGYSLVAQRWRNAYFSGDVNAANIVAGTVKTLAIGSVLVNSGVSRDLFKVGAYATGMAGILGIQSRKVAGSGQTTKLFAVSIVGSGTIGGITQLSAEDFGAGSAAFTINETRDAPAAGENKVTFNNLAGADVNIIATLTVFHNTGTLTAL